MRDLIFLARVSRVLAVLSLVTVVCAASFAAEAPRFVEKDGRWALLVDGQPYLMLGGQVHNSSAWPSELPAVWKALADMHANTVEAPVYWEQVEPQPGKFNWDNVDLLVKGAREHNLHVVLLWFGTWKNGNMHYVPQWVKTDTKRFRASSARMVNPSTCFPRALILISKPTKPRSLHSCATSSSWTDLSILF